MLYFSNISLIFQLCLYYLAIYTYKAKLKKKKYTFLQRNFYLQLLSFTENLIQTGFYWWQGTASSWLVGLSVDVFLYTYSERELDSLVSVTLGKPWFVTDRHLMLQTWLFCVLAFWQLYIPEPPSYNRITPKRSSALYDQVTLEWIFWLISWKKKFVKSVMQCFPDF